MKQEHHQTHVISNNISVLNKKKHSKPETRTLSNRYESYRYEFNELSCFMFAGNGDKLGRTIEESRVYNFKN